MLRWRPVTASAISGKNVPQKIDEAQRDQQQVVEQEDRLAREQRVQPVLGAQRLRARRDEEDRPAIIAAISSRNGTPSVEAPNAWIEFSTPRAHQERAEDRQHAGGQHQRHVPDPQHPAPLLDHHRVQERGRGQPRHQRRVLHRVPHPVAAPVELVVGPARAEHDPEAERAPGGERERARGADPLRVQPARDQRRHRERERDREQRVARCRASAGGSSSPGRAAAGSAPRPR